MQHNEEDARLQFLRDFEAAIESEAPDVGEATSSSAQLSSAHHLFELFDRVRQNLPDAEERLFAPEETESEYRAGSETPGGVTQSMADGSCSAEPAAAVRGPTRIGRFEIVRRLGEGGYGVVFLAVDPGLKRQVALKIPRPEVLMSPELQSRFLHEAEAAAALNHPNIVPVFEAGSAGPVCYIASAFCEGSSLAEWLESRSRPVAPRDAARLLVDLADAVQHAHSRGVLHRDLKPGNVVLVRESPQERHQDRASVEPKSDWGALPVDDVVPKITDFGLAKLEGRQTDHTRSGSILGTPAYISPEQTDSSAHEVGPASDIYSLGAVLYELLTGEAPFAGESLLQTLNAVRERDPKPPCQLRSEIPRDLEAICLKCLEKSPAARYPSAAALAHDLQRFLADEPVEARSITAAHRVSRWCRRNPAIASLAALVMLLLLLLATGSTVAAVWLAHSRQDVLQHLQTAIVAERVAAANEVKALRAEYEARLAQANAGRQGAVVGRRIQSLQTLERASELMARLNLNKDHREALRNEAVAAMTLFDLQQTRRWTLPGDISYHQHLGVDGAANRYVYQHGEQFFVRNLDDNRVVLTIDKAEVPARGVALTRLSPDGSILAIRPRSGMLYLFDTKTHTWILREYPVGGEWFDTALAFSADSGLIAVGGPKQTIDILQTSDGEVRCTLPVEVQPFDLDFSPDGGYVAYASQHDTRIHVKAWEDGSKLPTLEHEDPLHCVAWSPDGRFLAGGDAGGKVRVWDVAKQQVVVAWGEAGAKIKNLGFAPNGRWLAVASTEGVVRFWNLHTNEVAFALSGVDFAFSQDGRTFVVGRCGSHIERWDVAWGDECDVLAAGPSGPVYAAASHDGRLLCTIAKRRMRIWDLATRTQVAEVAPVASVRHFFARNDWALVTSGGQGVFRWPILQRTENEKTHYQIGPAHAIIGGSHGDLQQAAVTADLSAAAVLQPSQPEITMAKLLSSGRKSVPLKHQPNSVFVSPSGRVLATVRGYSGTSSHLVVTNVKSDAVLAELPIAKIAEVEFNLDESWCVVNDLAEYRFLDTESWEVVHRFSKVTKGHSPCALGKSGDVAGICRSPRMVELIDLRTGSSLAQLELQHAQAISSIEFCQDDALVVVGTTQGLLQIWDLRSIRRRLAQMDLDWDAPAFATPPVREVPSVVRLDPGRPEADSRTWSKEERTRYMNWTRLARVSAEIRAEPNKVSAYLRRAKIHVALQQFEHALQDVKHVMDVAESSELRTEAKQLQANCRSKLADAVKEEMPDKQPADHNLEVPAASE